MKGKELADKMLGRKEEGSKKKLGGSSNTGKWALATGAVCAVLGIAFADDVKHAWHNYVEMPVYHAAVKARDYLNNKVPRNIGEHSADYQATLETVEPPTQKYQLHVTAVGETVQDVLSIEANLDLLERGYAKLPDAEQKKHLEGIAVEDPQHFTGEPIVMTVIGNNHGYFTTAGLLSSLVDKNPEYFTKADFLEKVVAQSADYFNRPEFVLPRLRKDPSLCVDLIMHSQE